jgi:hypothetical protein
VVLPDICNQQYDATECIRPAGLVAIRVGFQPVVGDCADCWSRSVVGGSPRPSSQYWITCPVSRFRNQHCGSCPGINTGLDHPKANIPDYQASSCVKIGDNIGYICCDKMKYLCFHTCIAFLQGKNSRGNVFIIDIGFIQLLG